MSFQGFKTVATWTLLAMGIVPVQARAQIQVTKTIDTSAGAGTSANTGDGGPGIVADISTGLRLMAADHQGNVYFIDTTDDVVRRIDARTGVITTTAGVSGVACAAATSACGDGGLATAANLKTPNGVAVDAGGNVYIADAADNRVRAVNSVTGIITTVAGGGTAPTTCAGSTDSIGDGCQATLATIAGPRSVAFDPSGNMYIVDGSNRRIREVNMTTGVITTYAGVGVTSTCTATAACGDGGPALSAAFLSMEGIIFDAAGNLYIGDIGGYRIRMVLAATVNGVVHPVSTIAGTGVEWTSGSFGDGGPGTSANLYQPWGVAVDSAGNVYIADEGTGVVHELPALTSGASPTFGNLIDFAGGAASSSPLGDGGLPTATYLHAPFGISIDPFNVVNVTNANSVRVRTIAVAPIFEETNVAATTGTKLTFDGIVIPEAGDRLLSASIPSQAADFKVAASSCATNTTLAVGTACTAPVTFVPLYPGVRTAPLTFTDASGIKSTTGLQGYGLAPYLVFTPGTMSTLAGTGLAGYVDGAPGAAKLSGATNSAVDALGNIYVADTGNNAIRLISATTGDISTLYSTGLSGPKGVAVDAAGNVYIADTGNHVIRVINSDTGAESILAGTSGTSGYRGDGGLGTAAELNAPTGLSVDTYGALYIADTGNNAVRVVNLATGVITTVAGTGTVGAGGDSGQATAATLNQPQGVSFLPPPAIQSDSLTPGKMGPQLLIADTGNNKIREVNLVTGVINTVAGNGTSGYTGNGAFATGAELASPSSVSSDAAGDVYIADTGNYMIREVSAATGLISTVAGSGNSGYTGDGSSATVATYTIPTGITLDGAGSLYVTDAGASVLRKDSVASGTLSFGDVYINNTATLAVMATNAGNSATPLTFTSITAPSGFTYLSPAVGDCTSSITLAPGASCTMRFSFAPTVAGTVTGSLTVKTNSLFGAATSTETVVGVGIQAASSVNVNFNPASPTYQVSTSATINVTGVGIGTPSGNVTVSIDGGAPSASIQLMGGSATYALPVLTAGSHTITVSYSGDGGFLPSNISPTLVVAQATPAISWTPSATSQIYGTAIGLGVLDASSPVAGTITYMTTTAGGSPVAITASSVLLTGSYTLTATFVPTDTMDYTSATSQISFTVEQVPATISLAPSTLSATVGTPVALTATVQVNGATATNGQVRFLDGASLLGRVQVISQSNSTSGAIAGTTVLHVPLSVGTHSITAQYVGPYGMSSPISTAASITVAGKSPSFAVLAEATNATNALNYDFTVSISGNGYPGPSGTASLVDTTAGNIVVGSFPLSGFTLTPGATNNTSVALPIAPSTGVSVDLNNDGFRDTVSISSATNKVAILLTGATSPTTLTLASGHLPTSMVAADLNGDGNIDLAFAGAGWVDVYLGNGDGTFTAGASYTFTGNGVSITADDFNQDGFNDLAVALSSGSVAIFNGVGNGTFSTPTIYSTGLTSATAIASTNLVATAGGPASLVVGGNALSVLLNPGDGSGSLTLSQTMTLSVPATGLAVADFNGDGANDVVVTNGTINAQLLLNNGNSALGTSTALVLPYAFAQLKVVDLNGDGVADLAGVYESTSGADTLTVLLGNGNATFSNTVPTASLGTNALPSIAFPGDLNGDGIPDFAVLFAGSSTQQVFNTEAVAMGSIIDSAVNGSGVHVLVAQFPGDTNYLPSASNGVNVNTRSVSTPTLTWNPATTSIVYGTALSAAVLDAIATDSGTTVPGTYVYSANLAAGAGQTVTVGTILPVGTYSIAVVFTPTNTVNYNPVNATITFTVMPASATITVANATKVYGAALPTLTAIATGLVNGDALGTTVLAGLSTTATSARNVGSYPITAVITGTSAGNYIFNIVPGTLTVTTAPATLMVTSINKDYGAALPTFSASTTGLVNGDTLGTTVLATFSTTATQSSNAGTYPITAVVNGTSYSNYSFTVAPGTLTIVPVAATISVASASKAYGAALPIFSATASGLVNGDTFGTTVIATLSTTATASSNVGTYPITAKISGASTANYTFTINPGTLTIGTVSLVVNITSISSPYGGVPNFNATATGLMNGDTIGTTLIVNYTSGGSSTTAAPGTYTINGTLSGTSAGNYTTTINPGTLTITEADALVTLAASPAVSPSGSTVVLTATAIAATSGTPTGTIVFYNGTTLLGSISLASGKASLSVTSLPLGSDSITAFYSGSTDYYSVTSAPVTVTVVVPEFTITPATGSASLSVLPGGNATYTFAIAPQSPETVFGANITLSVSGLPTGATYTFTPAMVNAGSLPVNAQLVVSIPNQTLLSQRETPHSIGSSGRVMSGLAALLLLPFAVRRKRVRVNLRKAIQLCMLIALGGALLGGIMGCGSTASGVFSQSPKTYTLTVTGTSSTSTQSTNVTLTIQ